MGPLLLVLIIYTVVLAVFMKWPIPRSGYFGDMGPRIVGLVVIHVVLIFALVGIYLIK